MLGSRPSESLPPLTTTLTRLGGSTFRAPWSLKRVATNEVAAEWGHDHVAELTALREKLLDFDRVLASLAKDFGIAD